MSVETVRVATGADDVHERDDTTNVVDNATEHYVNATFGFNIDGGMRFTPVDVPQGSTINTGTKVTVKPMLTAEDDAGCTIHGEDVDNSAAWTTGAGGDLTGRARTTASVSWSQSGLGTSPVDTPDIASIIQEIVDRAGWSSGNALSIITIHSGTVELLVSPRNLNEADAPLLTIDYTAPAAGFLYSQAVIVG